MVGGYCFRSVIIDFDKNNEIFFVYWVVLDVWYVVDRFVVNVFSVD